MRALGLTAALVLALAAPAHAAPLRPAAPDAAALEAATALATSLSAELERSAAQDGGYRVALERLEEQRRVAQTRLDARVREVWTTRRPEPLGGLPSRLAAAGLRRIADDGAAAAVRVDRDLLGAVAASSGQLRVLRDQAGQSRTRLSGRVTAALQAQDRARDLLARAEAELAAARAQQVADDAADAADARRATETRRLAAETTRLAAARAALDEASAVVTVALAPAQSRRGRRAQETEAPLIALVEAAGAGYPDGYGPSGQVVTGLASWYGPGFVGSPTASGAPYDPERLTCAHKSLRLGTVLRVSANGRVVSCLVNDRGPYVGDRVLDMSRAGSRALGYDGVQQVVIEVLAPR